MADATYHTGFYVQQGGDRAVVASGGSLDVESGGEIDIEAGGAFKLAGTAVSATAAELDQRALTVQITLGTAGQVYVVTPYGGTVSKVYSVIAGALATADEVLTVKDGSGNSMGTITIAQSGSAAGDVDSLTPSSNNTVSVGDAIEIETDGGNSNAVVCTVTILIEL